MAVIEFESASPGETERIAAALSKHAGVGDVVTVAGELGSGKTTFIRGACRALGVTIARHEPDVHDWQSVRRNDCGIASRPLSHECRHRARLGGTRALFRRTLSSSSNGRKSPEIFSKSRRRLLVCDTLGSGID